MFGYTDAVVGTGMLRSFTLNRDPPSGDGDSEVPAGEAVKDPEPKASDKSKPKE
jgi:hypothetical protein